MQGAEAALVRIGRFFHRKKCLSDRHRGSTNSRAESLMALGMTADVRLEGVLEFAGVAEREGGAAGSEEEVEPSQGSKAPVER